MTRKITALSALGICAVGGVLFFLIHRSVSVEAGYRLAPSVSERQDLPLVYPMPAFQRGMARVDGLEMTSAQLWDEIVELRSENRLLRDDLSRLEANILKAQTLPPRKASRPSPAPNTQVATVHTVMRTACDQAVEECVAYNRRHGYGDGDMVRKECRKVRCPE